MRIQTSTAPPRRLPRAERRAQILRAAAGTFVRAGFDGTSVDDVARAAGVTRLIVYRIFETKEDLYRAVLEQVTTRLGEEFAALPADAMAADTARRRGYAARALLRVAREDPDAFRLLWVHAAHEPPFAAYFREFRTLADALAAELIAAFVHDPVVRAWAAPTLVAHLYDAVIGWLDRGDPDRDDEFVDLVSAGLRALVAAWATGLDQPG